MRNMRGDGDNSDGDHGDQGGDYVDDDEADDLDDDPDTMDTEKGSTQDGFKTPSVTDISLAAKTVNANQLVDMLEETLVVQAEEGNKVECLRSMR
jgi:hypothetical protein